MNKSAKNSVAFFLAAALITGVFSISTPSIIDIEATEDKRSDYKQNDRYEEKDYGYEEEKKYGNDDREKKYGYAEEEKKYAHDDRDKKYAYGEEEKKYGNENKYGYEEDNKYGDKDKDKPSVKYVSCQNININGKSFQKDGMNRGHSAYGEESSYPDLMAYGEESSYGKASSYGGSSYGEASSYGGSSYGENSYMNHNSKPDYVKETHKDVTIICIQKNAQQNKTVDPPTPEEECEDCVKALPGQSPNERQPDGTGQEKKFRDFIETNFETLMLEDGTIEALCDAIIGGEFTPEEIASLVETALPPRGGGTGTPPFVTDLIECLTDLLPI